MSHLGFAGVKFSYGVLLLFGLTQGPLLQLWHKEPMSDGFTYQSTVFGTYVLLLLPAIWSLGRARDRTELMSGSIVPFALFLFWITLSISWASMRSRTLIELVLLWMTCAAGLWLASSFDLDRLTLITWTAMQAGVLFSVAAVVLNWRGSTSDTGDWIGIYFNRNSLAPPAAFGALTSLKLVLNLLKSSYLRALLVSLVGVFNLYVTFKTGSETMLVAGLIGLMVGLAHWGCRTGSQGAHSVMAVYIWRFVATSIIVIPWAFTFGVRWLGSLLPVSRIGGREGLWLMSLDGFVERPIVGWGWLSAWHTLEFFPPNYEEWWRTVGGTWSHSGYFDLLLGGGVVAFLLFLLATTRTFWLRAWLRSDWFNSVVVTVVLMSMTQESFFIGAHFMTVLFMALMLGARPSDVRHGGDRVEQGSMPRVVIQE